MAQRFVCYDCGNTWDGYQPVCPGCGSINTHATIMAACSFDGPDEEPEDDDDPQPGDVSDVWTD